MAIKTPRTRRRSSKFGYEVREAVRMLSNKETLPEGLRRVLGFAGLNDGRILLIGHFHNAIARSHLLEALGKPENAKGTFEAIIEIIGGRAKTSKRHQKLAAELAVALLRQEGLKHHALTLQTEANYPFADNKAKAAFRNILKAAKAGTKST